MVTPVLLFFSFECLPGWLEGSATERRPSVTVEVHFFPIDQPILKATIDDS
jgi:hypothetical protein